MSNKSCDVLQYLWFHQFSVLYWNENRPEKKFFFTISVFFTESSFCSSWVYASVFSSKFRHVRRFVFKKTKFKANITFETVDPGRTKKSTRPYATFARWISVFYVLKDIRCDTTFGGFEFPLVEHVLGFRKFRNGSVEGRIETVNLCRGC